MCSSGPEHDVHFCSCWSVERLPHGQGTFCQAWIDFSIAEPRPSTMSPHEDILERGWRRRQGGQCWAWAEHLHPGKAALGPPTRSQHTALSSRDGDHGCLADSKHKPRAPVLSQQLVLVPAKGRFGLRSPLSDLPMLSTEIQALRKFSFPRAPEWVRASPGSQAAKPDKQDSGEARQRG